jgi:hypothetical protein
MLLRAPEPNDNDRCKLQCTIRVARILWFIMVCYGSLPHYITPWTLPDSLHLLWPRDTHGKVLRLSPNLAQAVLCIGRIEPWNIYIVAIKRLLYYIYYDLLFGFAFE